MKKRIIKKILELFSITIIFASTIGAATYTEAKVTIEKQEKQTINTEIKTIQKRESEETKQEENSEIETTVNQEETEITVEAQITQPEPETVREPVQAPVIQGNNITIAGVLYNVLMKDYTGEHFYLNHNENGEYNGRGVPYIDFRTDFNTRKTIIYAHSATSGNGPFNALQNYHYNQGYYNAHPYITINYEGNTYTYQIFSVYVSTADSEASEGLEYFHRMNYSDAEWEQRINIYKQNSEYDTGVSVSSSDKILILQTCSMDPNFYEKYYRYNLLIMAKRIY